MGSRLGGGSGRDGLLAGSVGCSNSNSNKPSASIIVFAAASLKKTFTDIGEHIKTDNPGTSVVFDFGGSSDLVTQLTKGANGDVFASADSNNMDSAVRAGLLAGDPVNFASNTLVIVTAPGNPKKIASFADLNQPVYPLSCARCPFHADPRHNGSRTLPAFDFTGQSSSRWRCSSPRPRAGARPGA